MNTEKITPAQDADGPIPDEALKALRREWAVTGPLGQMTYPQWCEQQTIYARRLVALLVNEVSSGMKGPGDDGNMLELFQFAAGTSLAWMPVLGAASATLGR